VAHPSGLSFDPALASAPELPLSPITPTSSATSTASKQTEIPIGAGRGTGGARTPGKLEEIKGRFSYGRVRGL